MLRMKAVVLLSLACAACASVPRTWVDTGYVTVIAHRGFHQEAPENTLSAIRAAIELGCQYVELDVRETADGEIAIAHGRSVQGSDGRQLVVADTSLAELRTLVLAGADAQHTDRVPTLAECLELCCGRIGIYVDHKQASCERVVQLLREHSMIEDVIVYGSSEVLLAYRRLDPKLALIAGHHDVREGEDPRLAELAPQCYDGHVRDWTGALVAAAHARGIGVWVDVMKTHDDRAGWAAALALGVDGIQTDHPDLLRSFLRERGVP
jgi:glycerophosphoryl diester phosphodiesterase